MSNFTPPTATGIAAAAAGIDPIFLNTPLVAHDEADAALGCRLLAKAETLNPIRSFKGRGTDWWLANLAASDRPIVSASAGNFGQGLAYAARRRGRRLTIFAATTANPGKVAAMRRLGATVVQEGADFDAAKAAARRFAATQGLVFVEDGGERLIAEGAGTIAREITETLDARAGVLESEGHQRGSVESLSVLSGEFIVEVGDRVETVKAGESVRYRCDGRHVIRNAGTTTAHATMVCILKAAVME